MNKSTNKYLIEVLKKLESFSKRKFLLIIIDRFLKTISVALLFFTFIVVLESLFNFTSIVRTILFFSFLFIVFLLFFISVIPYIFKYLTELTNADYYSLSKEVGKYYADIKDELVNSLQLINTDNKKTGYSNEFINSAFQQTYKKIKNIDFKKIYEFKKKVKLAQITLGIFILCFGLLNIFPGMNNASHRLLDYNTDFITPPIFSFKILPGNKQITKGEDVQLRIMVKGEFIKNIFLAIKSNEQTDYQNTLLTIDSTKSFNFKFKSVKNSFNYFAYAKDIKSNVYNIKVINRPIVKNLKLKISPPAYSKLPVTIKKDNGNITALKGSKITLEIFSNRELKNAFIQFDSNKTIPLKIKLDKATGSFTIKEDGSYKIIITDKIGNKNQSPISYKINTLTDDFPGIELISPKNDVSLSIDNRIPLLIRINDDFGFSNLLIKYQINSDESLQSENDYKSITLPFNKKNIIEEVNYIWNLFDLNLSSNKILLFYIEVFDNDFVNGPKSAKTKTIRVTVPSLDELLTKTDNSYKKSVDELKKTFKKAEELQKNLQKISQSLKKNSKKIDWKEQNKIKQTSKQFKELQKRAEKIADDLKKMKENLKKNNLLSGETLEKYKELQKLMDSFSSEEMKKALEQMQNLLSTLDRKKIQDAMKNLKFNEEQFKNSIERTLNLLKRIKVAQKIDELLTRTKDIQKKENDINKETTKSNKTNNKQLAQKQNQVSKSLKSLKKELEKLNKLMKELSDMPKESLDSLRNEFNKQKNKELSQKISKSLKNNKNQAAEQFQQQLSKNMKKMSSMVSQLKKEMQQKNQMETFVEMMKSLNNLISLSKDEEKLSKQNKIGSTSSFKKNAEKQNQLMKSLNRVMKQLSKLSQKTFAITPEMGKALGDARKNMIGSIESMQNRNGYQSTNKQKQAMGSLNDASSLLKSSLEGMMKGGGGQGGMMSLMQQLGQMAQQQMNLNNLTKLMQQNNGKFSQQQLSQLRKLQQQQELIRKSLQELNKEAKRTGKSKTLAADLDEILRQMQEVITNMNNTQFDEDVVQKQERILSKLLDAQRSVNERDYDKKRKSFTGNDILRKSPDNLTLEDEKKNALRDELLKAINEGYSKDYEDLIKKYFERLERVKGQK